MSVERDATTTAARAAIERWMRSDGYAHRYAHDLSHENAAKDLAPFVVDAVRPLIVGEEHDRLRTQIEAMAQEARNMGHNDEAFGMYRVLALLPKQ